MKKGLVSAALAAVLTVAATAALAQEAVAPPPAQAAAHGEPHHGDGPHEPHEPPGPMGPGFAVVNDLEQLRRLYAMSGREGEIIAVYHEVLNKTQDPMLRHYVYDSLAREQLKPANTDQAIATLRTSLSEDLVFVNKLPHGMPAGMQPPASQ
ncbi:hypothetical protein DSC91_000608 [Paraburkholderia caffeinilytica]|uniref:Uncharacterized protein n=1 Tax=Paraburkholderia caffeinilytica TaxID=1761016 RepID=A0ABQ1N690_9BURK|nr:hypothetical protein [Paraburkholderia caffeinilytica]AXL48981.1 hypothetical protein DSC91_000608 [Paraburkholderia caffeinilytica]GGC55480.1 hypothetical protein GCM10011400_49050 [Paraburkholderia caffeinilytica]CAB3785364.1 hypothetical protein LMG28690_02003 [Paraburkholderia caffeinilytica]